jgi:hypothetical protein
MWQQRKKEQWGCELHNIMNRRSVDLTIWQMGEMDLELASKQSGLHLASKHFSIPMHMFVAVHARYIDFKTQKELFHDGDSYSYAMTALDTPESQRLHRHVSGSPRMV